MRILVLNCGSSSVKYRLLEMAGEVTVSSGRIERIGEPGSGVADHAQAVAAVFESLATESGAATIQAIHAIGHRVVHGADRFTGPTIIDDEVLEELRHLSELAPLHNPAALAGIDACRKRFPLVPQVAVFDTGFYSTLPPVAYTYALPHRHTKEHHLRRFGFHGTSHEYVAGEAGRFLGRPLAGLRLITCHLGNGASVTAIKDGIAIDTSMGFTPLGGLVMGSRCGDIDPAVVLYLMEKESLSPRQMDRILNSESGVLGISGVSNDFRALWAEAGRGSERAALAIDVFCYSVRKFIGAYAAALAGLDVLVLTGGLGERDPDVRARILTGLSHLGVVLDPAKNTPAAAPPVDLSAPTGSVPVLVIETREELAIARLTLRAVGAPSPLPAEVLGL